MASLPYRYVNSALHERRERVFLIFVALFLGSMTMLNILGVSRFIDMSFEFMGLKIPFVLAVGVLPYPMTFLCTDFISEFWGRRRANYVVLMGLMLNVWLFLFLYIGGLLPPTPVLGPNGLPDPASYDYAFYRIRSFTLSAIAASMIAFMAAQFCDVYLYHFWKRLTKGRHLWLRNNGSTMVSQLVDTICVIYITHYFAGGLPLNPDKPLQSQLWTYIASGYVFKLVAALLDTIPFYLGVRFLSSYLQIDPTKEHDGDDDEPSPVPPPATQPVAVSVADSSDAAV